MAYNRELFSGKNYFRVVRYSLIRHCCPLYASIHFANENGIRYATKFACVLRDAQFQKHLQSPSKTPTVF